MKSRKRILQIVFIITSIICSVIFIPWGILGAWITPLPATIQEQIDAAVDNGFDGIIAYVDQAEKQPATYVSGWKDRENKIPADPQALFKIASISKLYVAAAVAKLVNQQRLSLDKTLTDYLPELEGRIENADKITLRMLAQHRSGIPDWIKDQDFPWDRSVTDVEEVLGFVLDDPANFAPDARYEYSNTNYLLIGNIIDKTLGYGHQEYIRQEILTPLGLTQTFGYLRDVDSSKVVSGYIIDYDEDVKMLDFVAASGSMVATAQDVGIFVKALNNGSLLSDKEQAIYTSIYKYEHTGLLPGYQSIARYHKDIDAVVILFANTSGGDKWNVFEITYNRTVKIIKKNSAITQ